jgi:hypothetical protein
MPLNAMTTRFWQQSGSQIHTVDFNMIPGDIMVTAALSGTTGEGTQWAGIVSAASVRAGEESFGEWWQWRSSLFREKMARLTVGLATGQDQTAQGIFTLFIF